MGLYDYPSVHGAFFFTIENLTVRSVIGNLTAVRFGAVFKYCESYGAGRSGFEKTGNPTMKFGTIFRYQESCGAVRFGAVPR